VIVAFFAEEIVFSADNCSLYSVVGEDVHELYLDVFITFSDVKT